METQEVATYENIVEIDIDFINELNDEPKSDICPLCGDQYLCGCWDVIGP